MQAVTVTYGCNVWVFTYFTEQIIFVTLSTVKLQRKTHKQRLTGLFDEAF